MTRKKFSKFLDYLLVKFLSTDKPNEGQGQWLRRADALRPMQNWQALLDWCREWTKSIPQDAVAWFNLGDAYNRLNRCDDAILALRKAVRIEPKDATAWYLLGNAYVLSGNRTAARDAAR
ncbi:MAG: tetratricopeptide repeat protein, partial [Syntrophales bacterium LBB04]|nr:tetratricopeptide repeat protein [Syntrophales bacterium LBB04]